MSSTAYTDAQIGLARTIGRRRPECPPRETARLLLAYDGATTDLVGLPYHAERAIYYDTCSRSVIACRFDREGLDDRGGLRLAALTDGNVERWVNKRTASYWAWLNPRLE